MELPPGLTEEQLLADIDKVVGLLAHQFVFGYMDLADIRQEATVLALEALPRYDTSRPLSNFLYSHVKNRLCNFKRNNYRRNDPPCRLCHAGRESEHPDGRVCDRYRLWRKRNAAKANLARPLGLERVPDEREPNTRDESAAEADAQVREALTRIDRSLPVELRSAYLQMRAGVAVPKATRVKVEEAVREILGDYGDAA